MCEWENVRGCRQNVPSAHILFLTCRAYIYINLLPHEVSSGGDTPPFVVPSTPQDGCMEPTRPGARRLTLQLCGGSGKLKAPRTSSGVGLATTPSGSDHSARGLRLTYVWANGRYVTE
jgi:hypothetical protein